MLGERRIPKPFKAVFATDNPDLGDPKVETRQVRMHVTVLRADWALPRWPRLPLARFSRESMHWSLGLTGRTDMKTAGTLL